MTDWNKFIRPSGVYAVDLRAFRFNDASFEPNGPVYVVGCAEFCANPVKRHTGSQRSARLFVGLNVGDRAKWSVDDVVRITKRVRKKQVGSADASFLLQRGLYTSRRTRKIVTEKSVQIVILDFSESAKVFEKQMTELARTLLRELKQETIFVELQRRGVVYATLEVT